MNPFFRLEFGLVSVVAIAFFFDGWLHYQFFHTGPAINRTEQVVAASFVPVIAPGSSVKISPDCEVIGLVVNGKPRAYLIHAMEGMATHVYNDLIDEVPVSVTYCDADDYARVFTAQDCHSQLDIRVASRFDTGLQLFTGNEMFNQQAKQTPFGDYPFERLAWGDWLAKHPNSDLFVGSNFRADDNCSRQSW